MYRGFRASFCLLLVVCLVDEFFSGLGYEGYCLVLPCFKVSGGCGVGVVVGA